MKKFLVLIVIITLLTGGWFAVRAVQERYSARLSGELQSETVSRGDLDDIVQADGVVQANRSAELLWQTSGTVDRLSVSAGEAVSAGQPLAKLEKTSLSQHVILARVELLEAQRELEDLLRSRTRRAEAFKAVEAAQQDLEDTLNNETIQAQALEAVAQAQKAVDQAELNLAIVVKRPSQQAIDQAYANLLMAKSVFDRTRQEHEKIQRQLNKPPSNYRFFESKALYRGILESLDLKLAQDQHAYERALEKYNLLLEPVDPLDRMVAEGNVLLRKAELDQARRELERVKNGPSPGEVAVIEARLADAQREFERWREGVDPAEITAAKARLAAAQAVLNQDHLRAPFSGVVTRVNANPGDQVTAGTPAFRLDDLSTFMAQLQVSEIDINKVKVGQDVVLRLDAVPGVEYHGRVIEVPLTSQEVGDLGKYLVKVEIIDADESVKPGMTASADIIISKKVNYFFKDGKEMLKLTKSIATSGLRVEIMGGTL